METFTTKRDINLKCSDLQRLGRELVEQLKELPVDFVTSLVIGKTIATSVKHVNSIVAHAKLIIKRDNLGMVIKVKLIRDKDKEFVEMRIFRIK